eukprot:COSAG01_NODE_6663_length_3557_cov_2.924523_5_plen_53_part_00
MWRAVQQHQTNCKTWRVSAVLWMMSLTVIDAADFCTLWRTIQPFVQYVYDDY